MPRTRGKTIGERKFFNNRPAGRFLLAAKAQTVYYCVKTRIGKIQWTPKGELVRQIYWERAL
jgi:hypothetical protein